MQIRMNIIDEQEKIEDEFEFGVMIINPILLKILFFLIKEVYTNMDIRILRYFLTVAKEQNFTKAAEQLNITQPTLSRQLAAFEEELGTALFIRESRSITLTEAGILLKRRAKDLIISESWKVTTGLLA